MDQQPYTTTDFRNDVQKQLVGALADVKLPWSSLAPILDASRAICRDDIRLNGRVAVHGMEYDGADLVDADEAYISMSVNDREEQEEWLSQTWWLSDIALADQDPERVRSAIAAIERSVAKLKDWLAAREAETGESGPGSEPDPSEPAVDS